MPLEFGAAGALAGALIPRLERLAGPPWLPSWSPAARLAELSLLVAAYLTTVALADAPAPASLALAALLAARLGMWRVRGDWAYAAIAGIAGPAVEAALTGAGAFDYADPGFAGIPIWLPLLWANGGLLIRRLLAPVVLPSTGRAAARARPARPRRRCRPGRS